MITEQNILTTEEKSDFIVELACIADSLRGIEMVSSGDDSKALPLLIAGVDIYANRLYMISQRLMEVSEIQKVA